MLLPRVQPVSRPVPVQAAAVTLQTLRAQEENRRRAAVFYEQLERESVLDANTTGELISNTKRSVKSGGDDSHLLTSGGLRILFYWS